MGARRFYENLKKNPDSKNKSLERRGNDTSNGLKISVKTTAGIQIDSFSSSETQESLQEIVRAQMHTQENIHASRCARSYMRCKIERVRVIACKSFCVRACLCDCLFPRQDSLLRPKSRTFSIGHPQ